MQPLLRQRRPQGIPTQPLQSIAVARSHQQTRVQIEPVGVRVARPRRCHRHALRWLAASPNARAGARSERHAAFDGGRRNRREHGRFSGPHIGRLAILPVARETAPFDETCHAVRDDCHDLRHIVARQPPDWMELDAVPVVREHAVQHQHVQVDIEIERAAEALQDRHGAAAAVGDVVTACRRRRNPSTVRTATPLTARHRS